MKRPTITQLEVFLTALLQVTLVAMNTVLISRGKVIPMLITGFGISFVWTFNVKKIAFGGLNDRIYYATGAMVGTGVGYEIAEYLITIIK